MALTKRELEIVDLVVDGLSNREIGERLGISARTVQSHLAAAMRKCGARSRTQLAVAALRAGMVTMPLSGDAPPGSRVVSAAERAFLPAARSPSASERRPLARADCVGERAKGPASTQEISDLSEWVCVLAALPSASFVRLRLRAAVRGGGGPVAPDDGGAAG